MHREHIKFGFTISGLLVLMYVFGVISLPAYGSVKFPGFAGIVAALPTSPIAPKTKPGDKPVLAIDHANPNLIVRAKRLLNSGAITTLDSPGWRYNPDVVNNTPARDRMVRRNSNAALCDPRSDLLSGKMYEKDIAWLEISVKAGFKLRISCINTGHVRDGYTHPHWRGVDIDMVNGEGVNPKSAQARRYGRWLTSRPNAQLPFEVGGPFIDFNREKRDSPPGPFFWDPARPGNTGHSTHFHLGFEGDNPPRNTGAGRRYYAQGGWF
jgi:hypothetical protein